jgi:hypothetical protein
MIITDLIVINEHYNSAANCYVYRFPVLLRVQFQSKINPIPNRNRVSNRFKINLNALF